MPKKLKPSQTALSPQIQEAVLSLPLEVDGQVRSVGDVIEQVRSLLEKVDSGVAQNPLLKYIAMGLMRDMKKRGNPSIRVSSEGEPYLLIDYGAREEKEPLPSLDELRRRAQILGVDISDLGRKKIEILKRIEAHLKVKPTLADDRSEGVLPPKVKLPR